MNSYLGEVTLAQYSLGSQDDFVYANYLRPGRNKRRFTSITQLAQNIGEASLKKAIPQHFLR